MPYNLEKPDRKIVEQIKARHPKATASDIRQWIHVWNGSFDSATEDGKSKGESEAIAFRNAWGVLKKRLGPKKKAADLRTASPAVVLAGIKDFFPRADEHQLAAASATGRCVVAAGAGSGKAQPLYSKVLLKQGPTRMGDVRIGDLAAMPDGTFARVLGVFPQGKKSTYKIVFSDGFSTECCADHLWEVFVRKPGKRVSDTPVVLPLERLRPDEAIYYVRVTEPIRYPRKDLPLDPYVLGCLLGDGGLSQRGLRFSTQDKALVWQLRYRLPEGCRIRRVSGSKFDYSITCGEPGGPVGSAYLGVDPNGNQRVFHRLKAAKEASGHSTQRILYSVQNGVSTRDGWRWEQVEPAASSYHPVRATLQSLGLDGVVSDTKFIPPEYLLGSVSQRIDLLQGLMDTDGTVSKSGASTSFTTVSLRLADDFCCLAQSLGCLVSVSKIRKHYKYKGKSRKGKLAYICTVQPAQDMPLFKLPRKLKRQLRRKTFARLRRIDRIEYVGERRVQCIKVDHPDHLYLTDGHIVTHNTTTMVKKIEHAVKELRVPPSQFLVCSFGGKSTEDMKEKITKAVGARAAQQMQIATIHGMCRRELIAQGTFEGELLADRSHQPLYGSAQTYYLKRLVAVLEEELGAKFPPNTMGISDIAMALEKWKGANKQPADVLTKTDLRDMVEITSESDEEGRPYLILKVTDETPLFAYIFNLYEAGKFPFSPDRQPPWSRINGSVDSWPRTLSEAASRKLEGAFKSIKGPRMDFFDMQLAFLYHMESNPDFLGAVQSKYSQIFVDEFQDTSPLQFSVVKRLGSHITRDDPKRTLFAIGDDKQSIYYFRGTRPQQFIDLADDPEWKLRKMPNNYRSTASIVSMANALIGNNEKQIEMPAIASGPNRDLEGDVELHRPETRLDCVDRCIDLVKKKREADPKADFSDFAVICRTNNELGDYELKMLLNNIPYTRKGGQNFLGAYETRVLLGYFKIATAGVPGSTVTARDLSEALVDCIRMPDRDMLASRDFRETFGRDATIEALRQCSNGRGAVATSRWRYDSFKYRARASCQSYLDQIEMIQDAALTMSTVDLLDYILDNVVGWDKEGEGNTTLREAIHAKLAEKEDPSAEQETTEDGALKLNIGNAEILFSVLEHPTEDMDITTATGFLDRLRQLEQMAQANEQKTTKVIVDPKTKRRRRVVMDSPDAVTLCTAHASKGLEWDYTFNQMPLYTFPLAGITFAANDAREQLAMLPDDFDIETATPNMRSLVEEWQEAIEEYEAERRLAYVAMTRARKHIYILSPATTKSGKPAGPSEFIYEAQVEEHATYSDMESMYGYDSLAEAIQHMQSVGRTREAMLLSTLNTMLADGRDSEAVAWFDGLDEETAELITDILSDTRGMTNKLLQPVPARDWRDWWPTPDQVQAFLPLAVVAFSDEIQDGVDVDLVRDTKPDITVGTSVRVLEGDHKGRQGRVVHSTGGYSTVRFTNTQPGKAESAPFHKSQLEKLTHEEPPPRKTMTASQARKAMSTFLFARIPDRYAMLAEDLAAWVVNQALTCGERDWTDLERILDKYVRPDQDAVMPWQSMDLEGRKVWVRGPHTPWIESELQNSEGSDASELIKSLMGAGAAGINTVAALFPSGFDPNRLTPRHKWSVEAEEASGFTAGSRVVISDGKLKGQKGTVNRVKFNNGEGTKGGDFLVAVRLDSEDTDRNFDSDYVALDRDYTFSDRPLVEGDRVKVVSSWCTGKTGVVLRVIPGQIRVALDVGSTVEFSPSELERIDTQESEDV